MLFMILNQIANDQIGVDKPSLHRMPPRPRAAFAAASRIWAKDIPLPFLLVLCFINNVTISEIHAIVSSYVGSCQTFAS
jgi:hypothetical protein